jgi:hypothetical protein
MQRVLTITVFALGALTPLSQSPAADKPIAETVDTANADYGTYPSNYEDLVKAWASSNLKDPESARFGKISRPRKEFVVKELKPLFGYSVCAGINAKNAYGGYVGEKIFWFFFRDGKIERAQSTEGFPGRMISRGHNINCDDGSDSGD